MDIDEVRSGGESYHAYSKHRRIMYVQSRAEAARIINRLKAIIGPDHKHPGSDWLYRHTFVEFVENGNHFQITIDVCPHVPDEIRAIKVVDELFTAPAFAQIKFSNILEDFFDAAISENEKTSTG